MDAEKRKCALVTGGAKGIGRAIAVLLAESGMNVVITENVSSAAKTLEEIKASGSHGLIVKGDVSDPDMALKAVKACVEEFGSIDILVNNAGITKDSLILRMKSEDWNSVIGVNLTGVFNFTKAASRYMIKQKGGRIVNITSIVGVTGNPGQANYSASKAGVIGLTKSSARELASRGITVNAIAPGYVITDMTESLSEKSRDKLMEVIPMKKLGQSEDIAKTVLFLISEGASYITGQTIHVNGGMYM